jgi:demethylmenaquinone methyltransferase/2-methoxy-6-polyprenyl-1,4-benzoquinol methylase
MPFLASFDCLWCGRSHATRTPTDLEGFAQLCPDCIGRAQDNGFLRMRLKAALAERTAATTGGRAAAVAMEPRRVPAAQPAADAPAPPDEADMVAYYEARAAEYDDWYLRRGRYSHGPIDDMAWQADLDQATTWLDRLPLTGEIVELAAGTGWWSPLLADKGELSIYDAASAPLDRARQRLVAHRLRAHIHERDAWAEPDRQVDGLFCGFWLSHVPRSRLAEFLALARRWLKPAGTFAFIDSRPDPRSGARDHARDTTEDVSVRRLADGREFRIPKVYYEPDEIEATLREAGFSDAEVATTSRFFLLGRAVA